jgi:hypothetical protein
MATNGWDGDRTMAEAEQGAREGQSDRCACGSTRFVLEAYLEVDGGRVVPEPVEVEALTCPECGREYEPIVLNDGCVQRGEFLGYFEQDEA